MKLYDYPPQQVVAANEREAKRILRENLGIRRITGLTRAKPPFLLKEDDDSQPFEVSEEEFCRLVGKYGGGMVYND